MRSQSKGYWLKLSILSEIRCIFVGAFDYILIGDKGDSVYESDPIVNCIATDVVSQCGAYGQIKFINVLVIGKSIRDLGL